MKLVYSVAMSAAFLTMMILPWATKNLYGLDWTDTTYHLQEAQNILQGLQPHVTLFTHVPGLSFVIEAWILKVIGATLANHIFLGYLYPLITGAAVAYLIFTVSGDLTARSVFAAAAFLLMAQATYFGFYFMYNFSHLSTSLSFVTGTLLAAIVQADRLKSKVVLALALGFFLGVTLLVKQSHGIPAIGLVFGWLFVVYLIERRTASYSSFGRTVVIALAVAVALAGATFLLVQAICGSCYEAMVSGLSGTASIKGLSLSDPGELFWTLTGIGGLKSALLFVAIAVATGAFVYCACRSVAVAVVGVVAMLLLPVADYFMPVKINAVIPEASAALVHSLTITLGLISLGLILSLVRGRSPFQQADVRSFLVLQSATIPMIAAVVAEQMSWPGRQYYRPEVSVPLAVIQFLSIVLLAHGRDLLTARLFPYIAAVAYPVLSLFFVESLPRRYDPASEGLVALTAPPSLAGWRVSPKTAAVVGRLRDYSAACGGDTLFELPIAPITYDVTGRRNSTGYFLPSVDTFRPVDADKAIDSLKRSPPDMLVFEPDALAYDGPFPAVGTWKLVNFVHDELIPTYRRMGTVADNFKTFAVYCRS